MKSRSKISLIVLLMLLAIVVDTYAQCPMCRMSAESNLANGGSEAKGLNTGILYMLSMPYLLVATMGVIWYRNKKSEAELAGYQLN